MDYGNITVNIDLVAVVSLVVDYEVLTLISVLLEKTISHFIVRD